MRADRLLSGYRRLITIVWPVWSWRYAVAIKHCWNGRARLNRDMRECQCKGLCRRRLRTDRAGEQWLNADYFGLKDNPKTTLDFASYGNYCHHAFPAAPPNTAHQKAFCLTENHTSCPVFRLTEKRPLPEEVAVVDGFSKFRENFSYRIIGGIFLLFAIGLTAAIAIFGNSSSATAIPEGTRFVLATNSDGQFKRQFDLHSRAVSHGRFNQGCLSSSGWIDPLHRRTDRLDLSTQPYF